MFRDLLSLLGPHISGQRAWDDAAAIHAIDRFFTFSSFHESARVSAERLRAAGLSDVEVIEAPADGRSVFADWMMPLAWEVEAATFDLLLADGTSERLADYGETPCCLAMWSAPTPPDGVEAEIVYIEKPEDRETWRPDSVRGKIVFTSAHPHSVKRLLLEEGAAGLLSDFQSPDAELPDAVAWINAFSDDPGGWALTAGDSRGWSFQISPQQGERLRARLQSGEVVRGRAVVQSELHEGTLPAVTGVIPGSGKEEVLLLGHQFEQGMVDNACGVGIMIETARALQKLIAAGDLPQPQRSIRFLFMSECYSTIHWVEERRHAASTIAALCIDAPCDRQDLSLRPLEFCLNPHSNMTFADALLMELARRVMATRSTYAWAERSFAMGTDNMIADSAIGIPCPWIGSHSRTWHSSADVPEALDPQGQELVARIAAAYAYLVASADRDRALDFSHLAAARGKSAVAAAAVEELGRDGDLDDSLRQIAYLAERHAEAVGSALKLVARSERARVRPEVRALQRQVRRAGKDAAAALAQRSGQPGHTPTKFEPEGQLATIRPRRLVKGPLTFDSIPLEEREGLPSPRWSRSLFAVLSWCDGRRSLAEACQLAARELWGDRTLTPDELVKTMAPGASSMLEYFKFLKRHNYVTW